MSRMNWDQLRLYIWKCYKLQRKRKNLLFIELFVSLVLSIIVAQFRRSAKMSANDLIILPKFCPDKFTWGIGFIGYTPQNPAIDKIIKRSVNNNKVTAYNSSEEMEDALMEKLNKDEPVLVGIEVENYPLNDPKSFDNLIVTFRFPSQLGQDPNIWHSHELISEKEDQFKIYQRRGFVHLQQNFVQSVVRYEKNDTSIKIPEICLRAYPSLQRDKQIGVEVIPHLIIIIFMVPCAKFAETITHEKSTRQTIFLNISGLSKDVHETATFIEMMVVFLMIDLIFLIVFFIPWRGVPALADERAPYTVVLLLLISVTCCAFTILLSSIFNSANMVDNFVNIFWILVVLFWCTFIYEMPYGVQVFSCFLMILSGDLGFQLIFQMDSKDHFGLWNPPFELGLVYIMLLIDLIIYLLLAIYIKNIYPGHHGVPKPWYYPYQMLFTSRKIAASKSTLFVPNEFVEYPKKGLKTIEMNNVTKAFPEIYAVKKISMDFYKNEVTVILGHNGSGKSVIIDLISGLCAPSAGSIHFLISNPTIGLSPQQDLFMSELTVKEHLYFFSRLRTGQKLKENSEINYLLTKLELMELKMEKVKHLPVSSKKKLSVAMAIVGNPSLVLLDSPTTDLDQWSRKIIWDLIHIYKNDRTIILTTNSVIEAEFLGDRVAVIKSGMLKCYGSGEFLKNKYGSSFSLVLSVNYDCEEAKVTDVLRDYVSCAQRNTFVGSELTYFLPERYVDKLEAMLKNLEEQSEHLHIQGYTISYGKLEELFTRMAENRDERLHKIIQVPITESFLKMIKQKVMTKLCKSQFLAMLKKKFVESKRSFILPIQLVVPLLLFFILLTFKTTDEEKLIPTLQLSLSDYENPLIYVSAKNQTHLEYFNSMVKGTEKVVDDVESVVLKRIKSGDHSLKRKLVVGADLYDERFMGWFNVHYLHTVGLSMGFLCNVFLKEHLRNESKIVFINSPLDFSHHVTDEINEEKQEIKDTVLKLLIGEGYTNVIVLFIVFCVKEASTQFKSLQLISGMNFKIFWFVTFLRDFLFSLVVNALIILVLYIFNPRNFNTPLALELLSILMIAYALAGIPFMYVVSKCFQVPSSAYVIVELISLAINFLMGEVSHLMTTEQMTHFQQFVMVIFPFYGFQLAVFHMSHWQERKDLCTKLERKHDSQKEACELNSMCCDLSYWSPKIWALKRPIVTMLSMCIVYFIALWISELGFYINKSKEVPVIPLFALQPDVRKETVRVLNLIEEEIEQDYRIVLKNVSKYYSRSNAVVKNVTFGMQSGEIFGLLGPNSCGKSTLLRMMTGDVKITYGQIYIMGLKMTDDRQKIRKLIGYGSQKSPLDGLYTPEELLLIFCRIRGFTIERGNFLSRKLAIDLDFYKSYRTPLGSLSPGTRKKVTFALAIIGNPPIIFLDEPTMGLDPSSEQLIWDYLIKLRDQGHSVVLSSNNARECEILCDRVAICIDGKIVALNTQQNLKKTFARGLRIVLNMAKSASLNDVLTTERFIIANITGRLLKERQGLILIYRLLDAEMSFSKIFHLIEEHRIKLKIDEYWLGHCSLTEVFMRFTEEHHDDRI